jgi:hypothetical protein
LGWASDDVAFSVLPGRSRLREIEKILAAENSLQALVSGFWLLSALPLGQN